jgi:hypothetical protein
MTEPVDGVLAVNVVMRDLVSQEVREAVQALPLERRLLAIAATLGGGGGLGYGLKALTDIYRRAMMAHGPASVERAALARVMSECRALAMQLESIELVAGPAALPAPIAAQLAGEYERVQGREGIDDFARSAVEEGRAALPGHRRAPGRRVVERRREGLTVLGPIQDKSRPGTPEEVWLVYESLQPRRHRRHHHRRQRQALVPRVAGLLDGVLAPSTQRTFDSPGAWRTATRSTRTSRGRCSRTLKSATAFAGGPDDGSGAPGN